MSRCGYRDHESEEDEEDSDEILEKKAITFLSQLLALKKMDGKCIVEDLSEDVILFVLKRICQGC